MKCNLTTLSIKASFLLILQLQAHQVVSRCSDDLLERIDENDNGNIDESEFLGILIADLAPCDVMQLEEPVDWTDAANPVVSAFQTLSCMCEESSVSMLPTNDFCCQTQVDYQYFVKWSRGACQAANTAAQRVCTYTKAPEPEQQPARSQVFNEDSNNAEEGEENTTHQEEELPEPIEEWGDEEEEEPEATEPLQAVEEEAQEEPEEPVVVIADESDLVALDVQELEESSSALNTTTILSVLIVLGVLVCCIVPCAIFGVVQCVRRRQEQKRQKEEEEKEIAKAKRKSSKKQQSGKSKKEGSEEKTKSDKTTTKKKKRKQHKSDNSETTPGTDCGEDWYQNDISDRC